MRGTEDCHQWQLVREHLDEGAAPSTIGAVRHAYRRKPLEKARRELTHATWSLRRYWFNLRYRVPASLSGS